jgi:transcriptional regulator with XRE-family HTH domain
MTGQDLRTARLASSWSQNDAAEKLGVTQAYLSMLERGTRAVSSEVAEKAVHVFDIPATALPLGQYQPRHCDESYFQRAFGSLGYAGFAYMKRSKKLNPAEVFMTAIDSNDLDARVTEALPWLPVAYPKMDWVWLIFNAKVHDRQNRLAFVTVLAAQIASKRSDSALEAILLKTVNALERSRLAAEDTLCRESMTAAERKWLRTHRSPAAKHWNLLTDLSIENLDHAFL